MTNQSAPRVTLCAAYQPDAAIVQFAIGLATKHGCGVHVGRYVSENSDVTSPGFILDQRLDDRMTPARQASVAA